MLKAINAAIVAQPEAFVPIIVVALAAVLFCVVSHRKSTKQESMDDIPIAEYESIREDKHDSNE